MLGAGRTQKLTVVVNDGYSNDVLLEKNMEMANKIASKPLQAVKKVKRAVQAALDLDIN